MKKIIAIVSYHFNDETVPRALKWKAIYKELILDNFVDVYCGDKSFELVHGKLFENRIKHRKTSFVKNILRYIRWPDYALPWLLTTMPKFCFGRVRKPDYIISVSHPFSSHLLGLVLKIRFPCAHWSIDIGDPFATNSNTPLNSNMYAGLNKCTEKIVLTLCNSICVNSEDISKNFLDFYGESVYAKIKIVEPVFYGAPQDIKAVNGMRCFYAGRFYAKERNFGLFIETWSRIAEKDSSISLDIFGPISEGYIEIIKNSPYCEQIRLMGPIEKSSLIKAVKKYDFVVNYGNKETVQVPSKAVDLLFFGLPIINIYQNINDYVNVKYYQYKFKVDIDCNSVPSDIIDRLKELIDLSNDEQKIEDLKRVRQEILEMHSPFNAKRNYIE